MNDGLDRLFFSKQANTEEKHLHTYFISHGFERSYGKNSQIFKHNDPANEAYFIVKGRVRIFQLTPEAKEVTFNIFKNGESLGMAETVLNCPRIRSAETMCKTTLLILDKDKIHEMFLTNPEFCIHFYMALTQQVLRYQNIIEDLTTLSVRERVINLLFRLCKERARESGCIDFIDFPITHEEIGRMVGSSRQTITSVLSNLRKEGIINLEQKKIKVLKRDA